MKTQIENLINKILLEEVETKSQTLIDKLMKESEKTNVDEKLHGNQKKLDVAEPKGKLTAADFAKLRKKNTEKDLEEESNEKWIQKTDMEKGALHKKLNVPQDEKIPVTKLKKLKSELSKKSEGDKKLSKSDSKLLKQVNLALTLKDIKEESQESNLKLTEDELIDLIEEIIVERNNITEKKPEGLKKTDKVLDASKKENEDYAKEVVEKMKKYLKDSTGLTYEENPKHFPKGSGELKKMEKKAYQASDAVGEYIENFARAAGLEELVYDEIEPHEDWVKDNIEGSSKTGNNPSWGNAVETELGEKLFKKSQKKPYSTEKRKGSYKRQTQPIDKAGEHSGKKSIDDMFAKLESKENKKEQLVSEDVIKMKTLISYNRKTQ